MVPVHQSQIVRTNIVTNKQTHTNTQGENIITSRSRMISINLILESLILCHAVTGNAYWNKSALWTEMYYNSLQWLHNEHDGVSNHQPHDCLLNCSFKHRSKKTSKLRVTGHCVGNSPVTGEFPAQMASNAELVSIWWRHHVIRSCSLALLYPVTKWYSALCTNGQ